MPAIQLIKDDCLKAMRNINDGSIDMILCDLPYGKTNDGLKKKIWGNNRCIYGKRLYFLIL